MSLVAGQISLPVYVPHSCVASALSLHGTVGDVLTAVAMSTLIGFAFSHIKFFRTLLFSEN